MRKGALIIPLLLILSMSLIAAEGEKMEISTIKEQYSPGEDISVKVSLFDSSNNPVESSITIILENAAKTKKVESTVESNKIVTINLGSGVTAGYWSAIASYNGIESKAIFIIESSEIAKFDISGDTLTVTNTGNIPYTRDIQILIGETLSTKKTGLDVGQKISFRLIAPDGRYSIRVTDGKTTFSKSDVALTGNTIGILDENMQASNPITGARIGEDTDQQFFSKFKNNTIAYAFVLVIIGAAILLAIERTYRRISGR